MKKYKDENFEKKEIITDAIIFFKDGEIKRFNAIKEKNRLIIFGHIENENQFIEDGGMLKDIIRHIEGGKKIKYLKKKEGI